MINNPAKSLIAARPLQDATHLPNEVLEKNLAECKENNATFELENAALYNEALDSFECLVKTLSSAIDARDPLTAGHSERVAKYALMIGGEMKITPLEMDILNYASLLHDIGKIGVCEEILTKESRLTKDEYRQMQTHVAYTQEILKNIHFKPEMQEIPQIASSHHERMDGTGYYRGLRGNEIPLLSRILAVADIFDAITSHRHYRDRMPFEEAIRVIEEESGTHFDTDCVACFMQARLIDLSRILLMHHGDQYDETGQRLLRKLDQNVTINAYRNILNKSDRDETETEIHQLFSCIYQRECEDSV